MNETSVRASSKYTLGHSDGHVFKNTWMLIETFIVGSTLCGLTIWGIEHSHPVMWVAVLLQGCWMQRIYCVGHESAHRKLFPQHRRLNDTLGQFFLWILLVPLSIFRKIHDFHHAANRKDAQTSALDVYVVPPNPTWIQRLWPKILWYVGILCGGWFIHSLVSILLFLLLPVHIARNVSPAFKGWTFRDQISSILSFITPIALHVLILQSVDFTLWVYCYLYPFGIFAIVYSLQLYIYHYRTSMGPSTLFHARRLTGPKWISWWLLNLNEHDTHHQRPKIVWYALPESHKPLPTEFAENQNVQTYFEGVWQQFNGPTLIEK